MGANYKDLLNHIASMQEHKFSVIFDDLNTTKQS